MFSCSDKNPDKDNDWQNLYPPIYESTQTNTNTSTLFPVFRLHIYTSNSDQVELHVHYIIVLTEISVYYSSSQQTEFFFNKNLSQQNYNQNLIKWIIYKPNIKSTLSTNSCFPVEKQQTTAHNILFHIQLKRGKWI